MKLFSRKLLPGALTLILLLTACNMPSAKTPPPIGTILPTGPISSPLPTTTLSSAVPTSVIPVTGMDVVTMQCQFCVNDEVHAVLIMPENASFLVPDPMVRVNCVTVKVMNGKRIVFCRGSQQTAFNLNVCIDNANCFQYPVTLLSCSDIQQAGVASALTPVVLTPVNTAPPPTIPASTSTTVPTQVIASPLPLPTQTISSIPLPTQTSSPLPPPTQTVVVIIPPTALATSASHLQPTRVASTRQPATAPSITQQPGTTTGLQDPAAFARWYFGQVWQVRNYQDLWDNYLTPGFKAHASPGGYEEYARWWSTVKRVDVTSVDVLQNDGSHAWVRVNVNFTMNDGRVISNQQYDYDLFYDPARQIWMFDYRGGT